MGLKAWAKFRRRTLVYWDTMDAEADAVPPGGDGVTMVPDFLASGDRKGSINGLVLGRTRGHICLLYTSSNSAWCSKS